MPPRPTPPLPPQQPTRAPNPEPPPTRPAAPGSDWTITRLDSGPGWSREILRHRSAENLENGVQPRPAP